MKKIAAILAALVVAACQSAPVGDTASASAAQPRPARVCATGSNICPRTASPMEALTREDIRQADVLPERRPAQ